MFQPKAMPAHSYDGLVIGVDLGNAFAQAAGQCIDRLLRDTFCLILGPHCGDHFFTADHLAPAFVEQL